MFIEVKLKEPDTPAPIILNTEHISEVSEADDGTVIVAMITGSEHLIHIKGGYKQMKRLLEAQEQE